MNITLKQLVADYADLAPLKQATISFYHTMIAQFARAIDNKEPMTNDLTDANIKRLHDFMKERGRSHGTCEAAAACMRMFRRQWTAILASPEKLTIPRPTPDKSKPAYPLVALVHEYGKLNQRVRVKKTLDVHLTAVRQLGEAIGTATPTTHDLSDDNLIELERYLEERGRTIFTITGATARIKALWTWAAKRRIVEHFPTSGRIPSPEPCRKAWTSEELAQLFAAAAKYPGRYGTVPASHFWVAWLRFGYETGERTGGMLAMTWDMVTDRGIDIPGHAKEDGKECVLSHQ